MTRHLFFLPLALIVACSRPAPTGAESPSHAAPPVGPVARHAASVTLPPEACSRTGYEAFFEAFVRTPRERPGWALPGAPLADFDMAMRDYSWVLASNTETLLDIDEKRSGDAFTVRARPVKRDENDEVIKVLGPERTYRFEYAGECWKFASSQ